MSTDVSAPEAVEPFRNAGESIRSIVDDLRESASVRSVYGDPIEVEGKTVIPVARISYGFGGGFGSSGESNDEGGGEGRGGGGGGGVSAKPVGVVEVSGSETRFVRFGDRKRTGLAVAAGLLVGLLIGRRRARG